MTEAAVIIVFGIIGTVIVAVNLKFAQSLIGRFTRWMERNFGKSNLKLRKFQVDMVVFPGDVSYDICMKRRFIMNIGNKISLHRKKAGMSQEELGEKLNISRQAVSRWETGEAIPDTEKIKILCSIFHVSADYLLFDEIEEETVKVVESRQGNAKVDSKAHFRIGVSAAVLAVGILLVVSALILALIETYQPYQTWYTEWGAYGTYLFRTWRVIPLFLGVVMTLIGIDFLHGEYKKM